MLYHGRHGALFVEGIESAPPKAQARLYSNWSYVEGMRAEEFSRAIAEQITLPNAGQTHVVVFNTVPHPQKSLITLKVSMENPTVIDARGRAWARGRYLRDAHSYSPRFTLSTRHWR